MPVRVLGRASIVDGQGDVVAVERKAREVLTILALRAPAAVELDELEALVWDEPPPSAVKTLRAHLSRLRTALASAGVAGDIEASGRNGYALVLDEGELDLEQVGAQRRRARTLRADGRPDSAATVLADARRAWRGDPELPDTVAAEALAQGWRRERRQLVQEHVECVVIGSDPGAALGELEALTTADPLDEPLAVLQIQALHRVGRQTDALRAAARARAALAEVGLEPGAELRLAESEVLHPGAEPSRSPTTVVAMAAVDALRPSEVRYTSSTVGHTAFVTLSEGDRDLLVLNPAMITIDGLLDEPRARTSLARLAQDARVVCLDRHGIGLSDPLTPDGDALDDWVGDVVAVMDELGLEQADVLANFDTGLIALELAATHPERIGSLVLTQCFATYVRSADYPYGMDPVTADSFIADAVEPASSDGAIDTVVHAAPSAAGDDEFRRWWNRIGRRAASPGTAAIIRHVATERSVRHRLTAVTAPTLVAHRRHCTNVDIGHARYLAEHLAAATLVTPAGTDALWFTDSADLLDEVVAFLRR